MKKSVLFIISVILSAMVFGQKLPFQGKLIESGSPVNGSRSMTFTIDADWTETHSNVQVTDGLYFVVLGSITPLPANLFFTNSERQLQITVGATALGPVTLFKPLAGGMDGLFLQGPTTGILKGGFYSGSPENQNLPYLLFGGNSNLATILMRVNRNGTSGVEQGSIGLNSTDGQGSGISPGNIWFRDNNNNFNAQMISFKGSTNDYSGQIWLKGPNSMNIELGSKHWTNADLPWMNLYGATGQRRVSFSADIYDENGSDVESGLMEVIKSDNSRIGITPTFLQAFNFDGKQTLNTGTAQWDTKNFGFFELFGPNSHNFYLGAKSWENNPDIPYLALRGSDGQDMLSLEGFADDPNTTDNDERGQLNLMNKNGKNTTLTAGYFANSTISGRMLALESTNWGNGEFGRLELAGVNSQLTILNSDNALKGFLGMAGNDNQSAMLRMSGTDAHIALEENIFDSAPPKVFIDIETNGNGNYGRLFLNGPNTTNFAFSADGGNSDIPRLDVFGKDGQSKMYITTVEDANGERGILALSNSNGEETTFSNNGTWGTVPFNMWSGAMVNGTLTINGNIEGTGTNNYNSDQRLKKDIQTLGNNALEKIEKLGSYSYYWRKDEFPQKNFSDDQQIGLIAQELEEQFPALVKTGSDGFKSVNYNGFTAVLLEAVKELNAKVEKLESKNNQLQAQLSASTEKADEMAELKKQVDFLTKLVREKMADSEKTAEKN